MSAATPITRNDLESKFRELKGEVDTAGTSARQYVVYGAVGGVLAVAGLAYLLGRRRGKKSTTVVEIKRV